MFDINIDKTSVRSMLPVQVKIRGLLALPLCVCNVTHTRHYPQLFVFGLPLCIFTLNYFVSGFVQQ